MTNRCALLFSAALACLSCAHAQSPSETAPQFEVTSIKQNLSGTTESGMDHNLRDRFTATNMPLYFLIQDAYELHGDYQLAGAPGWTWDKAYDVVGTYPGGSSPDLQEIHLMERRLLADRFGLKLHSEQREIAAYDLVLARTDEKLGPQLHKSTMDCEAWAANGRPKTDTVPKSPVSPSGERPVCGQVATRTWLSGGARTMQELAGILQAMVERPVIDKTGLSGAYDVDMRWARTDLQAGEAATTTSSDAPSLFTAVEEQLGLKLVPQKEKFEVLVIEHIQPPTPN
ncbi:MAG TPA: TIGR03435 family protein [Acidobacteriaceae bacterium]|nr:TIGR03435 family protein [Acidobacteriaceae bacterium]